MTAAIANQRLHADSFCVPHPEFQSELATDDTASQHANIVNSVNSILTESTVLGKI